MIEICQKQSESYMRMTVPLGPDAGRGFSILLPESEDGAAKTDFKSSTFSISGSNGGTGSRELGPLLCSTSVFVPIIPVC